MNNAAFIVAVSILGVMPGLRAAAAADADADARRGADFFEGQRCLVCHSVKGSGAAKAPDLSRRLDRNYTPAGIAARMWDHAPVMWAAMAKDNMPIPQVHPDEAADLFAFFYAARYFEKPGEAQRGKRFLQDKRCTECHSIGGVGGSVGPPVEKWESLAAPIILIERMWNQQTQMHNAMAARGIPWPTVNPQELTDMLVYLQNLPETRGTEHFLLLPLPAQGETLFRDKGCIECHRGALALENHLGDSTLTDVAAAMWNHAPQMRQPPPMLTITEWRQLVSYVWAKQFFATRGDATRGHKVFDTKKCAVCHNDASTGAPNLSKPAEPYSAITIVSALWLHGPVMLKMMQEKHIVWPQLTQSEMANVIAYLNSR
uniref:Cytochrome c, class I n=1 Tax=uncultured Acidobacteriota bacterium TaxID=171953 RepID=G8DPL4_9BACT|nr:cytochrome c, class I [uncultured Acidobacteriota bacterium]